jgi:hypothetical protein
MPGVHDLKAGDGDGDAWTDGLLVARSMPLSDLVAQLSRYRAGHLACDERVAQLRISGVFSLTDTERSLDLLQKTWPRVASAHALLGHFDAAQLRFPYFRAAGAKNFSKTLRVWRVASSLLTVAP